MQNYTKTNNKNFFQEKKKNVSIIFFLNTLKVKYTHLSKLIFSNFFLKKKTKFSLNNNVKSTQM